MRDRSSAGALARRESRHLSTRENAHEENGARGDRANLGPVALFGAMRSCERGSSRQERRDRVSWNRSSAQSIVLAIIGYSGWTSRAHAEPFPKALEKVFKIVFAHTRSIREVRESHALPQNKRGHCGLMGLVRKTGLEPARDCSR